MRPSDSTISELLHEMRLASMDIDECLLIGEKITLIYEAGLIYNRLRELVTSDYFLDDEYAWIKALGHRWNDEVRQYRGAMGDTLEEGHKENLDELENQIRQALDELLGPRYDLGMDDDEDNE